MYTNPNKIQKITAINGAGRSVDFTSHYLSFILFQDIESHFLLAELLMPDQTDIIHNFPFVGDEQIQVSIDNSILKFAVYTIEPSKEVVVSRPDESMVRLGLVSIEAMQNSTLSISRKFSDLPHNIIDNIVHNYLNSKKELMYNDSTELIDVYCNFWNPSDVINYATKMSKGRYNNFMFFEDLDGFVFKPLNSFLMSDAIAKLQLEYDEIEKMKNIHNIRKMSTTNHFDHINTAKHQINGGTYYQLKNTYGYNKKQYTYNDENSSTVSLGKFQYIPENMQSESSNVNYQYYDLDLMAEKINIQALKMNNIAIELQGNFLRRIGDLYEMKYPHVEKDTKANSLFNGLWMITRIKSEFNVDGSYIQRVNFAKNAYQNCKESILPESNGSRNLK